MSKNAIELPRYLGRKALCGLGSIQNLPVVKYKAEEYLARDGSQVKRTGRVVLALEQTVV